MITGGGGAGGGAGAWGSWEDTSEQGWTLSFPGCTMAESWIGFGAFDELWNPTFTYIYPRYGLSPFAIPLIAARTGEHGGVWDHNIDWAWNYLLEGGPMGYEPSFQTIASGGFDETWGALSAQDDPHNGYYSTNISVTRGSDTEYQGRIDYYLRTSGLGMYWYPMVPSDEGLMFRRYFFNWNWSGNCQWQHRGFKWTQSRGGTYPLNAGVEVIPPAVALGGAGVGMMKTVTELLFFGGISGLVGGADERKRRSAE